MHEMGIMNDVLTSALRAATENEGNKVTKISLKIGAMSGFVPRLMQSFFDVISKDTIAEGAVLQIQKEPAAFRCKDCGRTTLYDMPSADYACKDCGSGKLTLISGRNFQIISVAII